MASRCNAISELVRLWLEQRHSCLIRESLPVPVPYALSDIDFVAVRSDNTEIVLPNGAAIGPRMIVETKDEHDWESTGKEFGQALRTDLVQMNPEGFIAAGAKGIKFSMLREQHFRRAEAFFGSTNFDRLFVVHAIDPAVLRDAAPQFAAARIHWLTIREVSLDLLAWYDMHSRRAELRHDLTGDLFHLLVGFCGFRPKPSAAGA